MKRHTLLALFLLIIISLSGCNYKAQQDNEIRAENGYFDVSAEDLLTKVNNRIKENNSDYPILPEYSQTEPFGDLTEYCSYFDSGGYLRVDENKAHKVVVATLLFDMNTGTEQGANYSGYYSGVVGYTINPNLEEKRFQSIDVGNLAVNNIQSIPCGNFFCVIVKEEGVQQFRMYPLTNS